MVLSAERGEEAKKLCLENSGQQDRQQEPLSAFRELGAFRTTALVRLCYHPISQAQQLRPGEVP